MKVDLMISVVVALTCGALALSIELVFLSRRESILRVKEQAFRFHELRDRLQWLLIARTITESSLTYRVLTSILNLSIRNAGKMKLSEILQLSKAVDKQVNNISFEQVAEDIRNHPAEVQSLASEVFYSLNLMLISNDDLTFFLAKAFEALGRILNAAALKAFKSAARVFIPQRAEALHEARKYKYWGNRLSPSY